MWAIVRAYARVNFVVHKSYGNYTFSRLKLAYVPIIPEYIIYGHGLPLRSKKYLHTNFSLYNKHKKDLNVFFCILHTSKYTHSLHVCVRGLPI